jgi:hypothetical protein
MVLGERQGEGEFPRRVGGEAGIRTPVTLLG